MTRIFVDNLQGIHQQLFELDPDLTHHLRDVLRLSEGKQLSAVCRQSGQEYLAIIAESSKDTAIKIKLIRTLDRTLALPVISTIACGLPKGPHADQICEQVSQLGIEKIIFWCADRSVAQPKQAGNKLERWQKIAEAAARQSKQNSIPKVHYLSCSAELYSWLKTNCNCDSDKLLQCSLEQNALPINNIETPQGRAHLLIGPEGDFSSEETRALLDLGATPISLGPLVLRVETAAIVAASMSLATWGWR